MVDIGSSGGNVQAAVLVGTVLVEAILLYVVYGALETQVGPSVKRVLEGRCAVADLLLGRCSVSEKGGTER